MEDIELVLSTSEGESSSSEREDEEDDIDITDSDGEESEEDVKLPAVDGPSDEGGKVSNVAPASNESEVVRVKEKNNNKSKVQTTNGDSSHHAQTGGCH